MLKSNLFIRLFKVAEDKMNCKHCDKVLLRNLNYCDNACQHAKQVKDRREAFIRGDFKGRLVNFQATSWTREMVVNEYGNECKSCGVGPWHNDKPLLLEVNHIDGDAANNVLSNLELLCPNCHSQTHNYRALNKESARKYRRKPL